MNKFITIEGLPSFHRQRLGSSLKKLQGNNDPGNAFNFELFSTSYASPIPLADYKCDIDPLFKVLVDTSYRRNIMLGDIQPALRAGKHVIVFDWLAYTYSYANFCLDQTSELPFSENIFDLHNKYIHLYPDMSIMIDVDVEDGIDSAMNDKSYVRANLNRENSEFLESLNDIRNYLENLRRGYLDFGELCVPRWEQRRGNYYALKQEETVLDVGRVELYDTKPLDASDPPEYGNTQHYDTPNYMGATKWCKTTPASPPKASREALSVIKEFCDVRED